MIGAVSGVLELIVGIFGFMFFNLSRHQAYMRLMSRLFLAQTKDESLFKPIEDNTRASVKRNMSFIEKFTGKKSFSINRKIKFYFRDNYYLCLSKTFCPCLKPQGQRERRFAKMWKIGRAKIEDSLDVVKIIEKLRMLDLYFK